MPFVTEWFKTRAHLVTTPHLSTKIKSFGGHGDARNNVFQPGGKESWSTYTERLGHYFVANKVTEAEQKHEKLLFVCGPTTFKLIKTLADLHEQVSYHDLC